MLFGITAALSPLQHRDILVCLWFLSCGLCRSGRRVAASLAQQPGARSALQMATTPEFPVLKNSSISPRHLDCLRTASVGRDKAVFTGKLQPGPAVPGPGPSCHNRLVSTI